MKINVLILVMLVSQPVKAEIYKWVDNDGNVHFGDRAGSNNAVEIQIKAEREAEVSDKDEGDVELTRDEKRQRILDVMNEDREERVKIKEEEKVQRDNKKIKCTQLRDKLKNIERAAGVYDLDENGNRVFLSNKDRGDSEARLRKAISKNCR